MDAQVTERLAASARLGAARFLSWWKQGLVAGMPGPLRAVLLPAAETLVMRTAGRTASLERVRSGSRELAGTLSLDADAPPALARLLRERKRWLDILLPPAEVLRRELNWPLAAEANLRDALAYQLDRLSPIAAEAALFDYRVTGRDAAQGKIRIELAVVPRAAVNPWLAQLDACGAADALRVIGIDGAKEAFDFRPPELRRAAREGVPLRWRLYAALFAVLLVAALWLPLHAKHRLLALVEQDVEAARGSAEAVSRIQQQTDRLVEAIDAVVESRRRAIPVLARLEDLTRLIPDTAYVQRLDYDGSLITITGEADRSLELVEALAASPLFAGVEFSAPVRRNPITGRDRFQLVVTSRDAAP